MLDLSTHRSPVLLLHHHCARSHDGHWHCGICWAACAPVLQGQLSRRKDISTRRCHGDWNDRSAHPLHRVPIWIKMRSTNCCRHLSYTWTWFLFPCRAPKRLGNLRDDRHGTRPAIATQTRSHPLKTRPSRPSTRRRPNPSQNRLQKISMPMRTSTLRLRLLRS